jgi:tetratricopeptide (TPR) repeat protein
LLGELALGRDQIDEALKQFEQASALETAPAPLLRMRVAQMLVRKGELEKALRELEKIPNDSLNDLQLLELKGGILATLQKNDAAIATYKKLIALSPALTEEPYLLLTSLYVSTQQYSEAREVLNSLLKNRPDSVFAHYYLGRIAEMEGSPTEAEKRYKKALQLSPEADNIKIDLARSLGARKRFKEAIALCEEVLRDDPSNVQGRKLLSQLFIAANRVEDALKQLESLKTHGADSRETRLKIGILKIERRDFVGAEGELSLFLAANPGDQTARFYLGLAYAGLQKVNDALRELEKIQPEQPFFVESRILAAHLLRQEKRSSEGITTLQNALTQKPREIRLLGTLVSLQKELGDTAGAIQTMRNVIAVEPTNDAHHFTLAVLLDESQDREAALQAVERAIELNPKNAHALNYLGYALAEQNRELDRAERLIKQAIALDRDNGYFIDSLGWVYYQRGDYRKALKQLERAAKLAPEDAVVLEHLALTQLKVGERKKALITLKRALGFAPSSDDQGAGGRIQKLISELEQAL